MSDTTFKFNYGDHVKISRFPEHSYQVLEVRQLMHDREPHYYLQSLTTPDNPSWISESSLEKRNIFGELHDATCF
jgi:hypothetical protein